MRHIWESPTEPEREIIIGVILQNTRAHKHKIMHTRTHTHIYSQYPCSSGFMWMFIADGIETVIRFPNNILYRPYINASQHFQFTNSYAHTASHNQRVMIIRVGAITRILFFALLWEPICVSLSEFMSRDMWSFLSVALIIEILTDSIYYVRE